MAGVACYRARRSALSPLGLTFVAEQMKMKDVSSHVSDSECSIPRQVRTGSQSSAAPHVVRSVQVHCRPRLKLSQPFCRELPRLPNLALRKRAGRVFPAT